MPVRISLTGSGGEVGLDGTPALRRFWSDQTFVFERILSACKAAGGRIISIHSKRAASEVLDRLEMFPDAGVPIMHWYSGDERELHRAIDLGCWFSVGPIMLAGKKGRTLAAQMPRNRLVTETDGPFATMNSKVLFPWDAQQAISAIASIWGTDEEQAAHVIDGNLRQLSSLVSTV